MSHQGLHPSVLVDGFERAREATLAHLEKFKMPLAATDITRDLMAQVVRTSLRTKVPIRLAGQLSCEKFKDSTSTVLFFSSVKKTADHQQLNSYVM